MKRLSRRASCCESCENPVTTFTTEQALWLAGGSLLVTSFVGWLLYNAGKNTQQILDMQAYQAGTFGQATGT